MHQGAALAFLRERGVVTDELPECFARLRSAMALEPDLLEVRCTARCTARTGVEMEALTGAAVAALTIYDMTKALSKAIAIERLELLEKSGGKSGPWRRQD